MSKSQPCLKVMHITYDMRIGGTEMVIKNIIEGRGSKDSEMSIFCIESPLGPWGEDLQKSGTKVFTHARKPGFDGSLVMALRKCIKDEQVDVLHCHQYTPWVYGAAAALGLKCKVIFTEHGRFYPDSSSWKRKLINPLLCMLTEHITAISEATKHALVEFEFINRNKVQVIYNGIKRLECSAKELQEAKQALKLNEADFVFGTIARLDPIKNHKMMLRAFAQVKQSAENAKLIIVGDGELKRDLTDLVEELNIGQSVIFTGYIAYPKAYLASMDVFLLSSLSEGTSMTLLEALSLGKTCIVTDAGGNKEIIEHLGCGIVTENKNEDQFSKAMLRLLDEAETRARFEKHAKEVFKKKFEKDIMINAYQSLYEA